MHWKRGLDSFSYAWHGIRDAWESELNFRIQVLFAIAAIILGWYIGLTKTEFLIVIFMIGFVMTAEIFNTCFEELCDKFQPEHDPHIGKIKDLAAAGVLVSSIAALIVGLAIYLPYLAPWIY